MTFFYRIKSQSPTLEEFFRSLEAPPPGQTESPEAIPSADFMACLRDIELAAAKTGDFTTLCDKLNKPNEMLFKKMEEILQKGTVELDRRSLRFQ